MSDRSPVFAIRAWGPLACFTRPELKVERVSYEVMTPSAARAVLEAILWKPAIAWQIHAIEVHAPIEFTQIKRNEVGSKAPRPSEAMIAGREAPRQFFADEDRQQRNTMALRDVDYVIHASFALTAKAGPDDNLAKFVEMFERRLAKGQCFSTPYFGCREFAASFEPAPAGRTPQSISKPLGLMLHDIDYASRKPYFFAASLRNGVLEVPRFSEVVAQATAGVAP